MSPTEQARVQIRSAVAKLSDATAQLLASAGLSAPTPPSAAVAPPTKEEMRSATERLHKLAARLSGA